MLVYMTLQCILSSVWTAAVCCVLWLVDATAQYISAVDGSISVTGIHSSGLRCVAVLIGVYDLATGRPLFGCANQPFVRFEPQSNQ